MWGIHNEILVIVDMLPKELKTQLDVFTVHRQKSTRGKVVQKTMLPKILHPGSTYTPNIVGLPTRA